MRRWTKSLWEFSENLRDAATDEKAALIVRCMIEEVAKDCPMPLLLELGEAVLKYAKENECTL